MERNRPRQADANRFVESANGRLRDELLNKHLSASYRHAREIIEEWRIDVNLNRPITRRCLASRGDPVLTCQFKALSLASAPRPHADLHATTPGEIYLCVATLGEGDTVAFLFLRHCEGESPNHLLQAWVKALGCRKPRSHATWVICKPGLSR